ncbi:hypothetical protein [Streptomyces sp. NPDC127084]|uniref:hypothetical protein n=1 Tax=Streptomyces sp. NPDC127084 TaxID=3347133 RepID=UPI00365634AC
MRHHVIPRWAVVAAATGIIGGLFTTQPAGADAGNALSCSPIIEGNLIHCHITPITGIYALALTGTDSLLSVARGHAARQGFSINESSPLDIVAFGGNGAGSNGGTGGTAQVFQTVAQLKARGPALYYYIGSAGPDSTHHVNGGTATIVATQDLTANATCVDGQEDCTTNILAVAGGGGSSGDYNTTGGMGGVIETETGTGSEAAIAQGEDGADAQFGSTVIHGGGGGGFYDETKCTDSDPGNPAGGNAGSGSAHNGNCGVGGYGGDVTGGWLNQTPGTVGNHGAGGTGAPHKWVHPASSSIWTYYGQGGGGGGGFGGGGGGGRGNTRNGGGGGGGSYSLNKVGTFTPSAPRLTTNGGLVFVFQASPPA